MESGNVFPWEVLKAECLRLVCHQVCASSEAGVSTNSFGRRDEMISFLKDVTERGLDDALTALGESKQTPGGSRETTSGVKRKTTDVDIEEDQDVDNVASIAEASTPNPHQAYNTRFKGVKRVKLGREIPEGFPYSPHQRAPRKSAPAELASGSRTKSENNAGVGKADPPKRPRGRPRKNPQIVSAHSAVPTAGRPPTSSTKQVFDGVVVPKRAHPPIKRAELEEAAASHPDPDADADAEGDVDGDAEEIVPPDHVELNGLIGVASENDHSNSNQGDSSVP